jgi:hypothetical protein
VYLCVNKLRLSFFSVFSFFFFFDRRCIYFSDMLPETKKKKKKKEEREQIFEHPVLLRSDGRACGVHRKEASHRSNIAPNDAGPEIHPADGGRELQRVAHRLTDLRRIENLGQGEVKKKKKWRFKNGKRRTKASKTGKNLFKIPCSPCRRC